MARLFVGTFLDADQAAILGNLKDLNSRLSERWQIKARFVPLPKLHLTWLFLGDVEESRIDNLKVDLKAIIDDWKETKDNHAFQIEYDQLEVWSSLKSPRVLVLESTSECPRAESLNQKISRGLSKYCDRSEKVQRFKRFRPHLTVCRFSPDRNQRKDDRVKRTFSDFQLPEDFLPLKHHIGTVSLIESRLNAGPNSYSSIFDIALD